MAKKRKQSSNKQYRPRTHEGRVFRDAMREPNPRTTPDESVDHVGPVELPLSQEVLECLSGLNDKPCGICEQPSDAGTLVEYDKDIAFAVPLCMTCKIETATNRNPLYINKIRELILSWMKDADLITGGIFLSQKLLDKYGFPKGGNL